MSHTNVPTMLPLDDFYTAPVAVPPAPGHLLAAEPLMNRVIPPGSRAWRIRYTTTFHDSTPAVGIATVLAPDIASAEPSPVITWDHGTVGIMQACMPSAASIPFAGIPALAEAIAEGWVIVCADYAPNADGIHAYIIGEGEARSALDATRAARQLPEINLGTRTMVWGHSQGGHAALWTGYVGPRYAPDLTIVGVAAFAPASNMERIMLEHAGDPTGQRLGPYLATAYSAFYPDVILDEVVLPSALETVRQMALMCQFDPNDIPEMTELSASLGTTPVIADPSAGSFGRHLRENSCNQLLDVPLLIVQGLSDEVVLPEITDTYVRERLTAGQQLEYWKVPGRDHGGIVAPDSPIAGPLIEFTAACFGGTMTQTTSIERVLV